MLWPHARIHRPKLRDYHSEPQLFNRRCRRKGSTYPPCPAPHCRRTLPFLPLLLFVSHLACLFYIYTLSHHRHLLGVQPRSRHRSSSSSRSQIQTKRLGHYTELALCDRFREWCLDDPRRCNPNMVRCNRSVCQSMLLSWCQEVCLSFFVQRQH